MSRKLRFSIVFVLVLTLASAGYSEPGSIKLDFDKTGDVNTEPGFTSFVLSDNGTEFNGITVTVTGDINDARRPKPNSEAIPIYDEQVYRDFVYGIYPSGVTITLGGLGVNQECDITIYAFDDNSMPARLADWSANGDYLLTTEFEGGDTFKWPSPLFGIDYAFGPNTATADEYGRIVLISTRNPASPEDEDFAFVNALEVVPTGVYVEPLYAQNPVPFNGMQDAAPNVILQWQQGRYADTHDVYFGTDESDVNDANRSNPLGMLVSEDHPTTSYDPPGSLDFNTTYYWRIDEVNDANIWKGEVWSFKTYVLVLIASNPAPTNDSEGLPADVNLSWKKGEYAEKHDVYFGTDQAKVTDANRSNPLGVLVGLNQSDTTYNPPESLGPYTTYYWRIDEVNDANLWKGEVWHFTTYVPVLTDMPTWRVDARCFLDGPPGSFDDVAVKDPSIVYYGGKWHLFYTGRDSNYWRMGYASANSIPELNSATRHYMSDFNVGTYFCAPQVFRFEPEGIWYLIYQSGLGATFSTNTDINDPNGWTAGSAMGIDSPGTSVDYWCVSDGNDVYCFYSPMEGSRTILRHRTTVAEFPNNGWSSADVVATDTFEAVHVYKNKADGRYYMMVENMGATRWQQLWTAVSPGGTWTKIAEEWAAKSNLIETAEHWTDQVSHGEILRAGVDEKLEIDDIEHCEVLIQGVVDGNYGSYGDIPYDLGIIRQCPGDLDGDCDVDLVDFAVLASQWQQPPDVPSADIEPPGGDGIVNMQDLALLVDSWLWGK